jgi:hypothetical protein
MRINRCGKRRGFRVVADETAGYLPLGPITNWVGMPLTWHSFWAMSLPGPGVVSIANFNESNGLCCGSQESNASLRNVFAL